MVFGLVQAASADLVGHWAFDDGAGTIAVDSSGNGNDAVVEGGTDAVWVEGQLGEAVEVGNGVWVNVPPEAWLPIETQFTAAFWAFGYGGLGNNWGFYTDGPGGGDRMVANHIPWGDGNVYFDTADAAGAWQAERISQALDPGLATGAWNHWAFTKNTATVDKHIYLNGELWHSGTNATGPVTEITVFTIGSGANGSTPYLGVIDDFQLYDVELTQEEIQAAMRGVARELASVPVPEDTAVDVLRDVTLSWSPGEFAAKHDVYVGTVFDDVNDASAGNDLGVLVSQGQSDTSYAAGILEFGQTYFWRVDEVNGAPDNTVFKGKVWSLEVEPYAIPVEAITATASSSNPGDMGPENTINGIGLNELDQHSTEPTEMWLSGMGDPTPSIQYEFDKAYKLHEMWVWNSNQLVESFVGIGAKDVVIEHSLDGVDWRVLEGATQFNQAPGNPTYTANTMVDFGGALARFVKITISAGYGMLPQYGLSAVRFLYIPTFAREPEPAAGDIIEGAHAVFNWRAGREAASHEVYLGTDAENLSLVGMSAENSFDAGDLDFGTTYFWQIVEVNEAEIPTAHAGPIWSFSTAPFGIVDNFDLYDDDCNRIFFAWEDGLGHNGGEGIEGCDVPASNGNGGGSIVGNNMAPFAEQAIVYAGTQSLPFNYDNAFGASEATLTLDAQDWTVSGIKSLSLSVFGGAGNSGQLYLKINNTRVDGAPDISQPGWQPWIIDLSSAGGNLQNVTSLTIGVDGATAAGMLYIDEIRLYPKSVELVTPTAPDSANQLAHYAFDGDALDSSGNDNHGEENGGPVYGDGVDGQALQFDGIDDYVNVVLDVPENGCAVAFWFKTSNPGCGLFSVVQNPLGGGGHDRHLYLVDGNIGIRLWSNEILNTTGLNVADDQWHHIAYMYGDAIGGQKLYVDGLLLASGTKAQSDFDWQERVHFGFSNDAASNYLEGTLDDARIYDRTLSAAEIAWLNGSTEPVINPF